MKEETTKPGQAQEESKADLADQDLDTVAGGGAHDIDGIDVTIIKKPGGTASNGRSSS